MNVSMIDGVLTTVAGIYVCLIAFGAARLSKGKAKEEEWRRKWGGFIKVAGPLIAILGFVSILRGL
jgi:hypothetical protein